MTISFPKTVAKTKDSPKRLFSKASGQYPDLCQRSPLLKLGPWLQDVNFSRFLPRAGGQLSTPVPVPGVRLGCQKFPLHFRRPLRALTLRRSCHQCACLSTSVQKCVTAAWKQRLHSSHPHPRLEKNEMTFRSLVAQAIDEEIHSRAIEP